MISQAPLMGYSKHHHLFTVLSRLGSTMLSEGSLLNSKIGKATSFLDLTVAFGSIEKWPLCAWNDDFCSPQQNGGCDKATKTTHYRGEGTREFQGCSGGCLNVLGLKLHTQACMSCFINKRTAISKCLIPGQ